MNYRIRVSIKYLSSKQFIFIYLFQIILLSVYHLVLKYDKTCTIE